MGNGLLAFLVAISACVWIYSKLMRSTGNNAKNASIGATIAGILIFIAVFILAGKIS